MMLLLLEVQLMWSQSIKVNKQLRPFVCFIHQTMTKKKNAQLEMDNLKQFNMFLEASSNCFKKQSEMKRFQEKNHCPKVMTNLLMSEKKMKMAREKEREKERKEQCVNCHIRIKFVSLFVSMMRKMFGFVLWCVGVNVNFLKFKHVLSRELNYSDMFWLPPISKTNGQMTLGRTQS